MEEIIESIYQELNTGGYALSAKDAHRLTLFIRKLLNSDQNDKPSVATEAKSISEPLAHNLKFPSGEEFNKELEKELSDDVIYDTVEPPCINKGDGIEQHFFNDGYYEGYGCGFRRAFTKYITPLISEIERLKEENEKLNSQLDSIIKQEFE